MKIKTTYKNLTLTSVYLGDKNWECEGGQINNWNNHRITVINTDTKKRTSFEYWESISKCVIDDEESLIQAFDCFVRDALAGQETFEEFCSEYGYDLDSRKAYKTYKTCKKMYDAFERVVNDDIYNILNDLQDNYGC